MQVGWDGTGCFAQRRVGAWEAVTGGLPTIHGTHLIKNPQSPACYDIGNMGLIESNIAFMFGRYTGILIRSTSSSLQAPSGAHSSHGPLASHDYFRSPQTPRTHYRLPPPLTHSCICLKTPSQP